MNNAAKHAKKLQGIKDWIKETESFHESGGDSYPSRSVNYGTSSDEWNFFNKHRVKPDYPGDDGDDLEYDS